PRPGLGDIPGWGGGGRLISVRGGLLLDMDSGGGGSVVARSGDGGRTWSTVLRPPEDVGGVTLFDPAHMMFLNLNGRAVYRSADAGRTWQPIGQPGQGIAG